MTALPDGTALAGCAAKLRRGRMHADEFIRQLFAYSEKRPYSAIPLRDPKTGEFFARLVKDVPAPPVDEWAAIIGDAAHNYMAALDHLVCRLAIVNGADPDCRTTEFPIFVDPTRFDGEALRKIHLLAAPDQDAMRSLQPFAVPGAPRAHPLWLLRELDTIDKHRRLHVIAIHDDQWIDSQRAQGIDIRDVRRLDGTKAGEEILRFRIVGTGGPTGGAVDLGVTMDARFGPGSDDLAGIQVGGLLDAIYRYLRDRVFPAFAATVGPLRVDSPSPGD